MDTIKEAFLRVREDMDQIRDEIEQIREIQNVILDKIGIEDAVSDIEETEDEFEDDMEEFEDEDEEEPELIEGNFIATKTGKRYHLLSCNLVKNIAEKNKLMFDTSEEAEEEGLLMCHCVKKQI
jgi:hypothetical protein